MVTHKRIRGDKVVAEWQSSQTGFARWPDPFFAPVQGPDRCTLLIHAPRNHPGLELMVRCLVSQNGERTAAKGSSSGAR